MEMVLVLLLILLLSMIKIMMEASRYWSCNGDNDTASDDDDDGFNGNDNDNDNENNDNDNEAANDYYLYFYADLILYSVWTFITKYFCVRFVSIKSWSRLRFRSIRHCHQNDILHSLYFTFIWLLDILRVGGR